MVCKMEVFQTIKKKNSRAFKKVDQWIGHEIKPGPNVHPAARTFLKVSMTNDYSVEISLADLASLVAKADAIAFQKRETIPELAEWRTLAVS